MEDFDMAMSVDYVRDSEEAFNNAFDSWGTLVDMYRNGEITVNQLNAAFKCVKWLEGILPKKINDYNFLTETRKQEDPAKTEKIRQAMSKKNSTQLTIAQMISEKIEVSQ